MSTTHANVSSSNDQRKRLRKLGRRCAFPFTILPVAMAYWFSVRPTYGDGPPPALPSFAFSPATSAIGDIFLIPQTLAQFFAWCGSLVLALLLVLAVISSSLFANGFIAPRLHAYYPRTGLFALSMTGFLIALVWTGMLNIILTPFDR